MSIGGASFDLGIGLSKFEGDLARAREIAEAASRQINAALSGAGQGINGNGLSQSLAQANGAIEQTIQAVRQESVATAQAIQTVAAASEQASARAVAGTRELLNAQRALNTLVTGVGRSETVETGAGQVAAAYEAARESVERLKAADPAGALTAINRASAAARGGIDELNLSIARLAAGGASGGGGGYAELLAEYERLVSLGKTIPDEMAKAIGDIVNDPNLLNEEDASVKQMLAENAQAKSLTAALGSLETARKQLTVADDQGTQAATRITAAEREQARQADLLRQQQAQVARAQQSTQAVAANPDLALAANAKNILQGAGLDADAATKSVNQLQGAINAANRALAVKDVAVGFDQATAGADALRAALAALAGGNIEAGIAAEAAATGAFARALVETRAAAAAVVEELRAENLTLEQQRALQTELAAINSRSSAIQAAIVGAERAAATTTSAVRDALGAVEQGGVSAATTIRNLGVGVENLGSAMGDSRIGQFSGAIGRIGSLLESAGITSGVVATLGLVAAIAALGAGLAATIKEGLAFDAFLEDTRVRLEGATGSAKAAQQALDDIQQKAVSPQYRAFSTQDLAQGIEVLRRMGDQSEATQKRIADVAAETGQTFAQTAEQIGAISERIKGGLPLDDTLQSLVRAGVLTADYAAKLKIAQANGVDAATQLAIFNEGLDRFSGTAEKAGRTATGSFQAAKNALGELAGLALAPEFDALAKSINDLSDAMANPKFRAGVDILGKIAAFSAATQPLALPFTIKNAIADHINPPPPPPEASPAAPGQSANQLLQQSYQQAQAAYDAGRKAIEQYTKGFDEGSAKAFSDISDQVEKGLTALSGGKLSEAMQQKLEGVIEPLIAKAVDEIQKYGAVSAETSQAITAQLGSQADAVLKLATDYAGLRDAEQRAADAAKALASAQQLQSYHQQVAQDISAIDQQAIDDATKQQKADDDHFDGIIAGQKKIADGWQQLGQIFHDSYQQALDAMDAQIRADERANQDAANSARDQIQGKQDDLSDYQDAVARRRQDAQDQIRGLQGELSDYQDQINARRQQAQDALQAQRDALTQLQAQAQAAQQALSDHQAAFQAAIGGTVDLFNQEHTQQDEITRAIIAKWQAEIDGSRRAKDEADQKVRADTEHEHELTLAYDKRIQAARDAGRVAEAASLTRERDRVLAQQQQAGQVNRDEAAVAGDKLQDRVDAANRAARGQQSTDQVAVNNANALVTAAQAALDDATKLEAAKERAEDEEVKRRKATLDAATTLEQEKERDEDSEVKRRQAEITHLDRVESARARAASLAITDEKDRRDALAQQQKDSDAFYQGAADNINKILIPAIEEQKAKQHAADQQRIDDAKTIKDADDLYWKDRKAADDNAVTAAAAIKKSADDAVTAYQHQIDALKEINSQLNDANTKELAYLNGLRAVLGLTPLTALPGDDPNLPNDPTRPGGATPPATAPKAPPPGAPAQPVPAAAPPAPPPASKPPVYDPSTALGGPPPGYHSEYAYDGKQYYVRDGYHLEDYGVAQGSPPAQTAPPNPSDPGLTAGVGALNFARASLAGVGGGGGQLAALSTGPIAPIPGYAGIAAGAGARARDIGHLAGRRWEVAPAGPVNVHLFANSTINASDPADVDGMLDKMGDAFFGTGIAGLEIAKRAGTYPGRWGGSGA